MRDKKKAVFNILFLLLVFGLTVYGVFRGEDLESMMHSIRQAQCGNGWCREWLWYYSLYGQNQLLSGI